MHLKKLVVLLNIILELRTKLWYNKSNKSKDVYERTN